MTASLFAPVQVSTFAFAVLRVPELSAAVEFWTRGAAMQLARRTDNAAVLATADGRIALVLTKGGTGVKRLAYEVPSDTGLDTFRSRLGGERMSEVAPNLYGAASSGLTFADPDGYPLALVQRDAIDSPLNADPDGVRVNQILHPLIQVRDLERSIDFYTRVMGFQISDRIANVTAFLRCGDKFHHSMAIAVAKNEITLDHICFDLPDLDTLMRARNRLRGVASAECTDIYRHGGSESITFYFQDPHSGVQIEYCTGHRLITAADHEPRVLPADKATFDLWERY